MAKFQVEPHSFNASSTYQFGVTADISEDAQKPKNLKDDANSQNGNGGMRLVESQSRLVPTAGKEHVPKIFHEPHMEKGFRVLGQPWSYYIFSVFQLHNESVNIWSHLLACILTGSKLMSYSEEVDFFNDSHTWPLLAGLITGMTLYLCSAAAHCLQSRSELSHYVAFTFDYAGIGLYGLGSVIMHLQYCSEDKFYDAVQPLFVPAGCILAVAICFCCCISKTRYQRPYPFTRKLWQITPVAGIYAVLISPIVHRLISCYFYEVDCTPSIGYHLEQMAWFATSAFFFSAEFPQSMLAPGSCDHFFHGHQIFHFAIMMSTLRQADGVFVDFKIRREAILSRSSPTFLTAFGPIIGVSITELIIIYLFYKYTKNKLEGSGQAVCSNGHTKAD